MPKMKENTCSKLMSSYRRLYHLLICQGEAFQKRDFAFGWECAKEIAELQVLIEAEQRNMEENPHILLELIKDCIKENKTNTHILQKEIEDVQRVVKQLASQNKLIKSYLHSPKIAPQIIDRSS